MTESDPIDERSDPYEPLDPACEPWVEKMAAAEEGRLQPEEAAAFARHLLKCRRCAALFQAAHEGSQWMAFVDRRPPVPAGLLQSILARTGPGANNDAQSRDRLAAAAGSRNPPATVPGPGFAGRTGWAIDPDGAAFQNRHAYAHRLLTAAMAIFSIALTLNLVAGRLPQKPDRAAVTTQLRSTSGLVASYYAGFSKAQIAMFDQIRSVFEDLKLPAASKISNQLDLSL